MKRPSGDMPLKRVRTLRREQTDAEKRLWSILRSGRMLGVKFRRQIWIAGYIADFVCLEARLIVEADGGQHANAHAYDDARTLALGKKGFRVLRFWNHQILNETRMVADTIAAALENPHPPTAARRGAADPHPPTAARRAPPSPLKGEG